jgi:hypothetical protein
MWEKNPYYNPEALGLTTVAELEFSDMDYQFDTRVVWKNEDGALFTARDSGCSCPTPFEDYTSVEMLDRVDMRELEAEVKECSKSSGWGGNPHFVREAREFLDQVRAALSA